LSLALKGCGTPEALDLLDFGSGGSPYRAYFPNVRYTRADVSFPGDPALDYTISPDGTIQAPNSSFDIILSTQVVEHVPDVRAYFEECFRLLRPAGKLICTTHGYFPDHGCPEDYRRWTADGLRLEIEDAGFEVTRVLKLTAGSRAFFSVLDYTHSKLNVPASSLVGLSLLLFSRVFRLFRPSFYSQLDRFANGERIVDSREPGHDYYIGLMAEGLRRN
jgi:SAM-dependent methyltransferase